MQDAPQTSETSEQVPVVLGPSSALPAIRALASKLLWLVAVVAVPFPANGQAVNEPPGTYAFRNVTVIPMEGPRTLPGYTVVVRDGRIAEVGPLGSVSVPADATVIDGTGRYLVPGLSDMRIRLPGDNDPMKTLVVDEILLLYVANGITAARAMAGDPYQLELRDRIARGEALAPRLYVGAPPTPGTPNAESLPSGDLAVTLAASDYDFVTVEPGLSQADWATVVTEASRAGLPFAGQPPATVGVEAAMAAGISTLDRLEGYLEATRRDGLPAGASPEEVYRSTDVEKLRGLARRTAEAGVFVVPDQYLSHHLAGWSHLFGPLQTDSIMALPEYRFVSMGQKEKWVVAGGSRLALPGVTPESSQAFSDWRSQLLDTLHEEGVRILAGSDSPELFNVPGFALHREMGAMTRAGLTPYEVLETATLLPGYWVETLGHARDFGAVVQGYRADLLLLDENPLESLSGLQSRVGVMVAGRWLTEEFLQDRLAVISSRYASFDID